MAVKKMVAPKVAKKPTKANEDLALVCPIRGILKTRTGKCKGGDLSSTEERHRIDAIKYLLSHGYKKNMMLIEVVIARFGAGAKNSFRCDFAVLNVPVSSIDKSDIQTLLAHAIVLGEVKRDSVNFEYVKRTQVEPMVKFSTRKDTIGVYWDGTQQRVFWKEYGKKAYTIRSGPIAFLPKPGQKITAQPLQLSNLQPPISMVELFERIEDSLHSGSSDLESRYEAMLQIILAKIFDEHESESKTKRPMIFQDFAALGTDESTAEQILNELLATSVGYYGAYLPKSIEDNFSVSTHTLYECAKLIAPFLLTGAKKEVMQTFYMKFAKDLYRWDLAQYFTPPTVTDFIVELLNPTSGELVKDPACGSADFLVATFQRSRAKKIKNPADAIFGSDNDKKAVQISVLNMLLNGDGKTNIKEEDSLKVVALQQEAILKNKKAIPTLFNVLVCNPPFGVKIVERRKEVLQFFDLGYTWQKNPTNNEWERNDKLILDSQEKGMLFAEVCVRMTKPSGRIGIILPNGYLGNRSERYVAFREWLLRHCRLVSICGFPRFTFKTSGADVSASVVVLEKRKVPLRSSAIDNQYIFNVELIENVGWSVGDKAALPAYERNEIDGSYIDNGDGQKKIKSDFSKILEDIRNSQVVSQSPWLIKDMPLPSGKNPLGWARLISDVVSDPYLTLDPKRHSKKYVNLVKEIKSGDHLSLADIFEVVTQAKSSAKLKIKNSGSEIYRYVDIDSMEAGPYRSTEKRGWELPDRAKHLAESGDVYIGSIWSSVSKWCLIEDAPQPNTVVTNGCHRLRVRKGKTKYLLDAVAFFCSETYTTQMRALARGSDGLAEIHESDLGLVMVPLIKSATKRKLIAPYLNALKAGSTSLKMQVQILTSGKSPLFAIPDSRPHHSSLV